MKSKQLIINYYSEKLYRAQHWEFDDILEEYLQELERNGYIVVQSPARPVPLQSGTVATQTVLRKK